MYLQIINWTRSRIIILLTYTARNINQYTCSASHMCPIPTHAFINAKRSRLTSLYVNYKEVLNDVTHDRQINKAIKSKPV